MKVRGFWRRKADVIGDDPLRPRLFIMVEEMDDGTFFLEEIRGFDRDHNVLWHAKLSA